MPRVFKVTDIEQEEKEIKKDYFDRHTPVVICADEVTKGEKFLVKVRVGTDYRHPDDFNHFINFVQLWNRETLLAEARFLPGTFGNQPANPEVDFYIVAPQVSMNLTAMCLCTQHGLWSSEAKAVKVV
ncbi:MAG: desulfoferrodoxin family protein [Bacteroidota bacterium]|nr:desulfoferrodoxin family protein [Bacteroidota bacterium]